MARALGPGSRTACSVPRSLVLLRCKPAPGAQQQHAPPTAPARHNASTRGGGGESAPCEEALRGDLRCEDRKSLVETGDLRTGDALSSVVSLLVMIRPRRKPAAVGPQQRPHKNRGSNLSTDGVCHMPYTPSVLSRVTQSVARTALRNPAHALCSARRCALSGASVEI